MASPSFSVGRREGRGTIVKPLEQGRDIDDDDIVLSHHAGESPTTIKSARRSRWPIVVRGTQARRRRNKRRRRGGHDAGSMAAATYVASGGGSRLGRPSSSSCGDDKVAGRGDGDNDNRDSFGNGDALAPLPMLPDGGTAGNLGKTGASLPQQQQQQINQH
mmetsp:Transcript_9967/g.18210  ORF Transcript_9967/g.18210 Transcript_9967/m.18210 type:complete len:161 (-) Transcript_9967:491-973(-)